MKRQQLSVRFHPHALDRLRQRLPGVKSEGRSIASCAGCRLPGRREKNGASFGNLQVICLGVYSTPERTKNYEQLVALCASAAYAGDVLACPVAVTIDLHLYGKRRIDVDNCAKSILDGMNGIVYIDDNQVVDLRVRKLREKNRKRERVEIEIREAV